MATSEKKRGLGKIWIKPVWNCTECGEFVGSTAEWLHHTIMAHKDHKDTGAIPKSTKPKVNRFHPDCTDVSGGFAFLKSPEVNSL